MILAISDKIFSTPTLLWLVASVVAAWLLFGSIHRRRTRLTESLKTFVDKRERFGQPADPDRDDDNG